MKLQIEQLPNQLPVLFIHQPAAQCASVQIWFRAGSSLEQKGNEGIAHFLEHMFFKGTTLRPRAQIAHEVESFGGEINAFTSFDYTCYYINAPQAKTQASLHILLDMVTNPQFLEQELIPERGVVFEEYRRSLDNPSHYNFHQIQHHSFPPPYAHPILGHEETIKKFSRQQLTRFRTQHYNSNNALLIVAGDLKAPAPLKDLISRYHLPHGPHSQFSQFKLQASPQVNIHAQDSQMAQTTLIIQAPPYETPLGAQEDLAINALGYGESSPLHQSLVAKNSLANSASASTMFMSRGGAHFITVTCPPQNLSRIYDALVETLQRLLTQGISQEDIAKIKNQYIACKIYEKESLESFAFSLGHGFAQNGDIHSEEHFIERLKQCHAPDVHQSLINIVQRPIHLQVQIPRKTSVAQTKKLATSLQRKLQSLAKKYHSVSPGPRTTTSAFDPQVKLMTLKSGINFIHRYNPMTPSFNMYLFVQGGLSQETPKSNGTYNLLAQLLAKGYPGKSAQKLKLELDLMASSLNGFCGKSSYGLSLHGPSEYSTQLFDILFNSLTHPLLSAKDFNHEKKLIQRELLNQQENPQKQCLKRVNQVLFDGHPYALPTLGTFQSIKALQRPALIATHHKNLNSRAITIACCGDIELTQALTMVQSYTSSLAPRTKRTGRSPKTSPARKIKPIKQYRHHQSFQREQTHIFIGTRTFAHGHKNNLPLKMLTAHLSGQSSELFVKVRDQLGLCYVVQPIHFCALAGGYWGLYMASGAEKTNQAIEAIQAILDHYQKHGLSQQQFERVKLMILGQDSLQVQTNDDYAHIYSTALLCNQNLDHHHHSIEAIQQATHQECNRVIKRVLSKKQVQITVGKEGKAL